jgi:hypothetical protein
MRYMGILIFESSFVVWEIFDFGTGRYGPQKHHHVLTVDLHLLSSVSHKTQA